MRAIFHFQFQSKSRTAFDTFQLQQLEIIFKITKYPDARLRDVLAHRLKLNETVVQVMYC